MGKQVDVRWGHLLAGLVCVTSLSVGCTSNEFRCEEDTQCSENGFCEPTGFCSQEDDECASGRRYTTLSGSLSNECVAPNEGSSSQGTASSTTPGTSTSPPPLTSGPTASTGEAGETTEAPTTGPQGTTSDPSAELVFEDLTEADFAAGTYFSSRWNEGLTLNIDGSVARFESRVFDAGADANWTEIEWDPRGPYAKALPDDGAPESYDDGNADLSDNVLLIHMDEDQDLSTGAAVLDSSGQDHIVTVGGGTATPVAGHFGPALHTDSSTFISVSTEGTTDFQFGTDPFTWSAWARTSEGCLTADGDNNANHVLMGIEDTNVLERAHLWLGCRNPSTSACGTRREDEQGLFGGTVSHDATTGLGQYCGTSEIADDDWHHVALVKRGHAPGALELWVDGTLEDTTQVAFPASLNFIEMRPLTLGALSTGFQGLFDIDEVAIFRRALDSEEVLDLFRRGGLRIGIRVRTCDTPDCDETPFLGPDNEEPGAYFDVSPEPGQRVALEGLQGRFFQYEVRMSGAPHLLSRPSPVIEGVTVRASF